MLDPTSSLLTGIVLGLLVAVLLYTYTSLVDDVIAPWAEGLPGNTRRLRAGPRFGGLDRSDLRPLVERVNAVVDSAVDSFVCPKKYEIITFFKELLAIYAAIEPAPDLCDKNWTVEFANGVSSGAVTVPAGMSSATKQAIIELTDFCVSQICAKGSVSPRVAEDFVEALLEALCPK